MTIPKHALGCPSLLRDYVAFKFPRHNLPSPHFFLFFGRQIVCDLEFGSHWHILETGPGSKAAALGHEKTQTQLNMKEKEEIARREGHVSPRPDS